MMRRILGCVVLAAAFGCGAKTVPATTGDGSAAAGPECEPGRCLKEISALISQHRAEARACYETGRKRLPTLEGVLVVNYVIDGEGTVVEARQGLQDDQIADPEVVVCVVEFVEHLKFPKSAKRQTTRGYHRFQFNP